MSVWIRCIVVLGVLSVSRLFSADAPPNIRNTVLHLSGTYHAGDYVTVTIDRWLREDGTFQDLSSLATDTHDPLTTQPLGAGTYQYASSGGSAAINFSFSAPGESHFPDRLVLTFTSPSQGTLVDIPSFVSSDFGLRPAASNDGPVNISNRAFVVSGNPAITGFVVYSPQKRFVLVRASGPGLARFGVPNVLPDPYIEVHGDGAPATRIVRYSALDFQGTASYYRVLSALVGAFPFDEDSVDSCTILELPAGAHTVVVGSASGTGSGNVLTEVFFLP